jgi:hypothetical protein
MEPEVAAQPVAAAPPPASPSHHRTILIFAALGVLTGVLSYLAGKYVNADLLRFSFVPFGQRESAAPILPGVIFGLLVAGCCWRFGSRGGWLRLAEAVLVTTAAWILAYDATVRADSWFGSVRDLTDVITDLSRPDAAPGAQVEVHKLPFSDAISFGTGGLVGGLGTCFAVALANPRFRRPGAWLLTVLIATALGAIEKVYDLLGDDGLLAMFVLWQAAVIASIAWALGREKRV